MQFLNALLNTPIVPETKTRIYFICILGVFVMCVFVLIF